MNRTAPCLLLLTAVSAAAQTTTPSTHRAVHRPTAADSQVKTAPAEIANPADNPPNVPAVLGSPKPLYALRYVDITVGAGPLAQPRMYYSVRYTGWLTDGTKFDSSEDHPGKELFTFPYGGHRVIPGWDTGFEGMHVGGKRRLYIPYQLAYGVDGRPPIPAKSDLIFDLELVAQSETPPPPPPPADSGDSAPPSGSAPASTPQPHTKPEAAPQNP